MLIGPMQGAMLVTAEMVRRIRAPKCYRMVTVSLYDASNEAGENATFDYWPITDEELEKYDFIVVDDVAESLRTFVAMRDRLAVRGAAVRLTTLVDKPTSKRVPNLRPDFISFTAGPVAWLLGEGMNDGPSFEGEAARCVPGVWEKISKKADGGLTSVSLRLYLAFWAYF